MILNIKETRAAGFGSHERAAVKTRDIILTDPVNNTYINIQGTERMLF